MNTKLTPRDYRNALMSQNAGNGCALAQALAEVFLKILEETRSTEVANAHPIVRLYLAQLVFLNGGDRMSDYAQAIDLCERMANMEAEEEQV